MYIRRNVRMEQMIMKKMTGLFTVFCMAALLAGCGAMGVKDRRETAEETGRLKVAATLFPYYDFTRQIAGDLVDLTMVVPAGMDSHSFEPTPADMMTIQEADVLVCNGGALEHWLTKVLEAVDTSHMKIITGMDQVDAVEEILVEGMEQESVEDDGHGHIIEYDEHVWTSPVNAGILVNAIKDTLIQADPANGEAYESRAAAYMEQLEHLDEEFRDVVEHGSRKIIILGDKFPFRYFADEYGLSYRAAFSGCSTDTEPSARTIAYLIDKMKEEEIPVIYYLELTSHRVAEIISEETGAEPLLLHSCHNVTRKEFDGGVTYLELMEQNVENLRKGLD